MTRISRWSFAVALGMLLTTATYAVPPAYTGPMGNLEEPALRPYKWMFHGLKALTFQMVDALDRGNRKTPGVGMAEGVRGVRMGTVEVVESCFKGAMLYSPPPRPNDYKKAGSANEFIDNDPLLRNVSGPVLASQLLEHYPVVSPDKQEKMAETARAERERTKAMAAAKPMTRKQAQAVYVGDRIPLDSKDPYKGNLLRLVR